MEIRKTIKEIYQKYQYWQAPRCEACGVKLIDQGRKRILFEGNVYSTPGWTFKISCTEKGSLRFREEAVGAMSGIVSKVADQSWCKQDAPNPLSLIRPDMTTWRRKGLNEK